jgi:hypothetical protein
MTAIAAIKQHVPAAVTAAERGSAIVTPSAAIAAAQAPAATALPTALSLEAMTPAQRRS